jgi:hypothetical protein
MRRREFIAGLAVRLRGRVARRGQDSVLTNAVRASAQCLLCPESEQVAARQRNGAVCHKRTHASQQKRCYSITSAAVATSARNGEAMLRMAWALPTFRPVATL